MPFTTPVFLFLFLPLSLLFYQFVPAKLKNIFILVTSLLFYGWSSWTFLPVMIVAIMLNWLLGILMSKYDSYKKLLLIIGILTNIGLLIYSKYLPFISASLPAIDLPLGISFFTFHSLSYLIDIYRGQAKPASLISTGIYHLFFPQVAAGPINRYVLMQSQLDSHPVLPAALSISISRFIKGLGEKMLLANTFGLLADQIFGLAGSSLGAPTAWVGLLAYTLQIYFDFAGYSNMAIGMGELFGFHLTDNFNYPYIAKSITEFWSRWHMSLTSWLRQYVYFPLGGNRLGTVRTYLNIFLVFLVSGLWHGAGWHYIVWGLWHGLFMVIERWGSTKKLSLPSLLAPLRHLYTLLIVMIGWAIFRSPDLPSALNYLASLIRFSTVSTTIDWVSYFTPYTTVAIIIGIILSTGFTIRLPRQLGFIRIIWLCLVFALSLLAVASTTYSSFIYFKF